MNIATFCQVRLSGSFIAAQSTCRSAMLKRIAIALRKESRYRQICHQLPESVDQTHSSIALELVDLSQDNSLDMVSDRAAQLRV